MSSAASTQLDTRPDFGPGLAWKNITYDIPLSKSKRKAQATANDVEKGTDPDVQHTPESKRILHGLSGQVRQGEFVAILGASGAGKTTLLSILSARLSKVGVATGEVTYKEAERDPATWKRTVGYVEQDDAMLSRLTVGETIGNAADLRLSDKGYSKAEKKRRAEETVEMLRLGEVRDTKVGGGLERGVSGGERKRTSIGIELVSDVTLLFLDEPTSGLDSYAAALLVDNLVDIVRTRQLACLMTVHQPSWAVFCKLDRVILLAKGGVYYDGPPRDTVEYFKKLGYDVPEGANPADVFIEIAEGKGEKGHGKLGGKGTELVKAWSGRANAGEVSADAVGDAGQGSKKEGRKRVGAERAEWPTKWTFELGLLFKRFYLNYVRDKQTLFGTIGQEVFILLIVGFAFFRLGESQTDLIAKLGVLFFILINDSFSVLFPLIVPFPLQRAVLVRERSSGLYRTSSFFLAKLLLEIPNAILPRLPYYTVLYFMIGLRLSASAFFTFVGVCCLHLTNSIGLGLFIGTISPTVEIAQIIAPAFNVVFFLFGGTFLPSPPPWFIWIKWISPIGYGLSALAQNEFRGVTFSNTGSGGGSGTGQSYATGDELIAAYNIGRFTVGQCMGFLGAVTLTWILGGYLGLRWSCRPRLRFI